jgi:hypothetical protein
VHYLLSYNLLSKNVKVQIYRSIILPVFLYDYETLSLTLREECRLMFSKIRSCGGYLGLRGTRKQGIGEDCITKNFMLCTPHQISFG